MSISKLFRGLGGVALTLGVSNALAEYGLNLTKGVTPISEEVYDLHMLVLGICVVIGMVVFGVMFYSIMHHRKSKGAVAAEFHESTKVEVIWTVIPFLILISMAIPATRTLIAMEDPGNPDMTIKVTGYQWQWHYDYLGEDVDFFSRLDAKNNEARQLNSGIDPYSVEHYLLDVDKPLVVPIEQRIRFLITSSDVIHAWWVPVLGWKKDAIPGFINEAWAYINKPGTYRGQCAELCGRDHGFMPIVLIAKTQEDYQKWLAKQKGEIGTAKMGSETKTVTKVTMAELMSKGKAVYQAECENCHQSDGHGVPGMYPPIAGSPIAKGDAYAHTQLVLDGAQGTPMQSFRRLEDLQLAAVITYQRNAFGNQVGDQVQPSEIKLAR